MTRKGMPFREWLDSTGFPVADIASLCGTTRQAVYRWKNGESSPSLANFKVLSKLSQGKLTPDSFSCSAVTDHDAAEDHD